MTSTEPASLPQVTIGVDTHKHFHVAHAADKLGRPLGRYTMPTTSIGYGDFLAWAQGLGHLQIRLKRAPWRLPSAGAPVRHHGPSQPCRHEPTEQVLGTAL